MTEVEGLKLGGNKPRPLLLSIKFTQKLPFSFINSLFKIGEEERAVKHFEKLLSYSNHLGLFSEDLDFKTKRLLGNFPQAYSHLALVETAINLSKVTKDEKVKDVLS